MSLYLSELVLIFILFIVFIVLANSTGCCFCGSGVVDIEGIQIPWSDNLKIPFQMRRRAIKIQMPPNPPMRRTALPALILAMIRLMKDSLNFQINFILIMIIFL